MTKVAIPTSASELEELLNDSTRVATLLRENQFGEFVSAYSRTMLDRDGDLVAQINEGMQAGLADFLRRNEVERDVKPGEIRPGARVDLTESPVALGVPLNSEFTGLRDFMRSTIMSRDSRTTMPTRKRSPRGLRRILE